MVGRTNVGGGGSGSAFSAYLQIATDPSAVITAVNLAGDTFSGTANSSGSLVMTVTAPGTYTITESYDGETATESAVIADNGSTISVVINTAWDGHIYKNGNEYSSITGGWITSLTNPAVKFNPTYYTYALGELVKGANSMTLAIESSVSTVESGKYGLVSTLRASNAIDVTNFSNMVVSYSISGTNLTSSDTGRASAVANGVDSTIASVITQGQDTITVPLASLKSTYGNLLIPSFTILISDQSGATGKTMSLTITEVYFT